MDDLSDTLFTEFDLDKDFSIVRTKKGIKQSKTFLIVTLSPLVIMMLLYTFSVIAYPESHIGYVKFYFLSLFTILFSAVYWIRVLYRDVLKVQFQDDDIIITTLIKEKKIKLQRDLYKLSVNPNPLNKSNPILIMQIKKNIFKKGYAFSNSIFKIENNNSDSV